MGNKMHKFGQIVTISHKRYRVTRCCEKNVCRNCDVLRHNKCLDPNCKTYMPIDAILKSIK